jgi:hypothetical protein
VITTRTIGDRAPAFTAELKGLLVRMGRSDLADQMEGFTIRSEDRNRLDRRRSFFAGDERRSYSIEVDIRNSVAILDVDGEDRVVALHILSGDD